MKKDVTEIFKNYRECVRHLWNTFFRNIDDGWHSFINIERDLYEALVLKQIYGDSDFHLDEAEYVKSFIVEPESELKTFCVLLCNELPENNINWEEITITVSKTELRFMDYFDWEENGVRDYKYIKCRIVSCQDNLSLLNKDILIDSDCVKIYFENT